MTLLTTSELAEHFGVKHQTVITHNYLHGHFRGYVPVSTKKRATQGRREFVWALADKNNPIV